MNWEGLERWIRYLTKDKKILGVWVLSGGVVAVLIGWVFVPNIRGYFKLRKKEKILKTKVIRYRKKYNQLINVNDAKLQEKVNEGLEVLPLYHNAPLIIGILSKLGADENVRLNNVVFSPGEVASDSVELGIDKHVESKTKLKGAKLPKKLEVKKLEIRLRAIGGLENIRRFLISLEKVKPLIRLKSVSLMLEGNEDNSIIKEASASGVGSGGVSAQVEIEFFAARLPVQMPRIEDPVYVVPVEKEEKYQQLLKEYKGFSQVQFGQIKKSVTNKRQTPFFYEGGR